MAQCWHKGHYKLVTSLKMWAQPSQQKLKWGDVEGSGLLTNRDGAGVAITSLGGAQKATGPGNSGHCPEAEIWLPHLLLRPLSFSQLPPAPWVHSALERTGPWAWISVKPRGENAPWNHVAPEKGATICFFFHRFPGSVSLPGDTVGSKESIECRALVSSKLPKALWILYHFVNISINNLLTWLFLISPFPILGWKCIAFSL